jgi:hypothetical protein
MGGRANRFRAGTHPVREASDDVDNSAVDRQIPSPARLGAGNPNLQALANSPIRSFRSDEPDVAKKGDSARQLSHLGIVKWKLHSARSAIPPDARDPSIAHKCGQERIAIDNTVARPAPSFTRVACEDFATRRSSDRLNRNTLTQINPKSKAQPNSSHHGSATECSDGDQAG